MTDIEKRLEEIEARPRLIHIRSRCDTSDPNGLSHIGIIEICPSGVAEWGRAQAEREAHIYHEEKQEFISQLYAALKREAELERQNNDLACRHAALLTQNVQQEEEITNLEPLKLSQTQYNELLLAVCRKFPDESRHQTALRYIREAELKIEWGSGGKLEEEKP